jgi:hypothetical protein
MGHFRKRFSFVLEDWFPSFLFMSLDVHSIYTHIVARTEYWRSSRSHNFALWLWSANGPYLKSQTYHAHEVFLERLRARWQALRKRQMYRPRPHVCLRMDPRVCLNHHFQVLRGNIYWFPDQLLVRQCMSIAICHTCRALEACSSHEIPRLSLPQSPVHSPGTYQRSVKLKEKPS